MAEDAPRILDVKTKVKVEAGHSAELRARVTGHRDPVIAWEKKKNMIQNDNKHTVGNIAVCSYRSIREKIKVRLCSTWFPVRLQKVAGC